MTFQRIQTSGIVRGGPAPTLTGDSWTRSDVAETADQLPEFFPEIEASYQVSLSPTAGRVIRREIERERYRESAGWLFCDPRNPSTIVAATGPGADGVLSRSSVTIGEGDIAIVRELCPHLELCGDWHSHPRNSDTDPSTTDRRAWQRGAELTRSHWVSLVYLPAANVWSQPTFSAWITVRNGNLPFTEPLGLKEL